MPTPDNPCPVCGQPKTLAVAQTLLDRLDAIDQRIAEVKGHYLALIDELLDEINALEQHTRDTVQR